MLCRGAIKLIEGENDLSFLITRQKKTKSVGDIEKFIQTSWHQQFTSLTF